jgi:hypothetical protein
MSTVDPSRLTNPPKGTAMYHNADSWRARDSGVDAGLPLARAIVVLACALVAPAY